VGLFADLYELTMAAAFSLEGVREQATFDLFVRALPDERNFLVACGIEQAVEGLTQWFYTPSELDYLESLGLFSAAFLDELARLRFTGTVSAVAEGEVVFAGEPLLTVTAPVVEAQLVETYLLNVVGFQTMVASKAARVALAAGDRRFIDFSARRDHGADAAFYAARAAFVGGASGTSLVSAGAAFGLPVSGTMAHSYVMSHDDEREAFRSFLRAFPGAVLLIDTYDTLEGARRVVEVLEEIGPGEARPKGVRIDSGDLDALSRKVRAILDAGGGHDVQILVSGDLDEHSVHRLVQSGAPIDAFGVGTRMGTSADHPYLSVVYKLVELDGQPRVKLAPGKKTLPGRKQVHRRVVAGAAIEDVVTLAGEEGPPRSRPLLFPVVHRGRRVLPPADLVAARERRAEAVAGLPAELRSLHPAKRAYPVSLSRPLARLARDVAHDGAGARASS
jgi:nicotinate phosphoribosyltransferase